MRQQPHQGGHVPFLYGLLLGVELAPGRTERRRVVLSYQAHLDGARPLLSDGGPADLFKHALADIRIIDQRDARGTRLPGLLLQYGGGRVRDRIEKVLLMATSGDVRLGVLVVEIEGVREHRAGRIVHDPDARVVGQQPDVIARLPRRFAGKTQPLLALLQHREWPSPTSEHRTT